MRELIGAVLLVLVLGLSALVLSHVATSNENTTTFTTPIIITAPHKPTETTIIETVEPKTTYIKVPCLLGVVNYTVFSGTNTTYGIITIQGNGITPAPTGVVSKALEKLQWYTQYPTKNANLGTSGYTIAVDNALVVLHPNVYCIGTVVSSTTYITQEYCLQTQKPEPPEVPFVQPASLIVSSGTLDFTPGQYGTYAASILYGTKVLLFTTSTGTPTIITIGAYVVTVPAPPTNLEEYTRAGGILWTTTGNTTYAENNVVLAITMKSSLTTVIYYWRG